MSFRSSSSLGAPSPGLPGQKVVMGSAQSIRDQALVVSMGSYMGLLAGIYLAGLTSATEAKGA